MSGGNEGYRGQAELDAFDARQARAAAAREAKVCEHCWHQWGSAGGSVGSNGEASASGVNRCCHCGLHRAYDYHTGPSIPPGHGPWLPEILRNQG